jgi:hypothetical protein
MRAGRVFVAVLCLAVCAFSQNEQSKGKREEQRSCIQCHSLRLVDLQRLSLAAWQKEVDKMIGWGAVVADRQALIDYLAQEYGLNKPAAPQELTANGVSGSSR